MTEFVLNPFPNKPGTFYVYAVQFKSFYNTVGKGEMARNEPFLRFPQCFLPLRRILHL